MLTEIQIKQITTAMEKILCQARPFFENLNCICDPHYSKGREKHPITMVVYSAFVPHNQIIDDAEIKKKYYGRSLCLPQLQISEDLYSFYNQSAHPYDTKEVIDEVKRLGSRFHILEFTISEDYYLAKLEQVDFDGLTDKDRAQISKRVQLYNKCYNQL